MKRRLAFLASLAAAAAVAAAAAPVRAEGVDCKLVVPGYPTIWLRGARSPSGNVTCHGELPAATAAPATAVQMDVDGWRVVITPGGNVSATY